MDLLVAAFCGMIIGAAYNALISKNSFKSWERGFNDGLAFSKRNGYILARNEDLDEIMVEHGDDLSRYKRVIVE